MNVFVTKYVTTRHQILQGMLLACDADTGRAAIRLPHGEYALVDAEDWYASPTAAQNRARAMEQARIVL